MSIYDIFMLAVMAAAILFGLWKGLAWQVASLAAIFVSYFVAINFYGMLAPRISAQSPWNEYAAMFILYVGTSLAVWIGFGFVRTIIDEMQLDGFDHQIGAVLGAVKGALLCIIVTLFAVTLLGDTWARRVCNSYSGYFIASATTHLRPLLPAHYTETIAPYFQNFQDAMEQHGDPVAVEKAFRGEVVVVKPTEVDESSAVRGQFQSQPQIDFSDGTNRAIEMAREAWTNHLPQ